MNAYRFEIGNDGNIYAVFSCTVEAALSKFYHDDCCEPASFDGFENAFCLFPNGFGL